MPGDFWTDLRYRLRALLHPDALDRELDEELRFHLEHETEKLVRAGLSLEAARREARISLGGVARTKDDARDARGIALLDEIVRDLRYAVRTLRRSPSFALVAIATLALGIGATTAVFTVVDGVLIRPLPFPEPDRLVLLSYLPPPGPFISFPGLFDHDYVAFRERDPITEKNAAYGTKLITITGAGEPTRLDAGQVTPDFFATLGVAPALGRTFARDDDDPERSSIVVLSDSLWRAHFAADPRVIGSVIKVDGAPRTVVGVMPPGFAFPSNVGAWIPMRIALDPHRIGILSAVARLRSDVSLDQARATFAALAPTLSGKRGNRTKFTAAVTPLKDDVVGNARRPLLVFAGAVALVLLIGCTNVANLLLMRSASRGREMAMRAALGASRRRLVMQLLVESTLLGVAGGLAGVALAFAGVRVLLALAPLGSIPRLHEVHVDTAVLAFAMGTSLLSSFVFGFAPALHATRPALRAAIGDGGRTAHGRGFLRGTLVVGEIALALVLLTGAGLMLRSFSRMRHVDLGFSPQHVITATVELSNPKYQQTGAQQAFVTQVLDGLAHLPGVTAAATVNFRPLGSQLTAGDFHIEGGPQLPPEYVVDKMFVSGDYFRTMGIAVRSGRSFDDRDQATSPGVVIVSQSVARKFWGDRDPIGKRLSMSDKPGPGDWLTIVGVVDDVVQKGVTQGRDAGLYQPYTQANAPFWLYDMSFVVRTPGDAEPLMRGMRQVLRQADAELPIGAISAMDELVAETTGDSLFQTRLLGAFSLLALLLAAIGVYGVLAYAVAEQTREIGVRLALGAEPKGVVRLMLRRAAALVLPGLALGILGALAATRVLQKLLFGVAPTDPATFASVVAVLAVAALVAAWAPAKRASRVDPVMALRQE